MLFTTHTDKHIDTPTQYGDSNERLRVGQDSNEFNVETNDNGQKLISVCELTQMRITSTLKPHKSAHQWTWPDHILLNGLTHNHVFTSGLAPTSNLGGAIKIIVSKTLHCFPVG